MTAPAERVLDAGAFCLHGRDEEDAGRVGWHDLDGGSCCWVGVGARAAVVDGVVRWRRATVRRSGSGMRRRLTAA